MILVDSNPKGPIGFLQKSILVTVAMYFFSSAFPFISTVTEIFLYLSILASGFYLLKKENIFIAAPMTKYIFLFVIWCFITVLFSSDIKNSFHDWLKYLLYQIIILYLFQHIVSNRKILLQFIWIISFSLSLVLLLALIDHYIIHENNITSRLDGINNFAISINNVGIVAIIPFFFGIYFFTEKNNTIQMILSSSFIIISFVSVILTQTRASLLGFIFPIFILVRKFKIKRSLFITIIISLIMLFVVVIATRIHNDPNYKSHIIEERPTIWRAYSIMVLDNPVFGIGFGMSIYNQQLYQNYIEKLPIKLQQEISHRFYYPHNLFLDIAVRTGVIGLILFLLITTNIISIIINLFKFSQYEEVKKMSIFLFSCISSILIQGIFTDFLLTKHSYIMFILFGLTIIIWKFNKYNLE